MKRILTCSEIPFSVHEGYSKGDIMLCETRVEKQTNREGGTVKTFDINGETWRVSPGWLIIIKTKQ